MFILWHRNAGVSESTLFFLKPPIDHTWPLKKRKYYTSSPIFIPVFYPIGFSFQVWDSDQVYIQNWLSSDKQMWTLKPAQDGISLPRQLHFQWKKALFYLQIKK